MHPTSAPPSLSEGIRWNCQGATVMLARLWPLSCMAERVGDALAERGGEFPHLGLLPRQEQTLLAPELPTHGGKAIGEGRTWLAVPGVGVDGRAGTTIEACREQGYDRE